MCDSGNREGSRQVADTKLTDEVSLDQRVFLELVKTVMLLPVHDRKRIIRCLGTFFGMDSRE